MTVGVILEIQWDLLLAMLLCAAAGAGLWNRLFRPRLPWPWVAAFVVLALLPVAPALREGFVYGPFDTNVRLLPWASGEHLRYRPKSPGLNDVTLQLVPWQTEARRQLLAGRVPLLDPYAGAGQPLLGNGQAAPFSLVSLLALPFEVPRAQALRAFLKTLLALCGAFLAARQIGCRAPFALVAAVAYGYGGSIAVWHLFPHAEVMALFPFAWLASERLVAARPAVRWTENAGSLIGYGAQGSGRLADPDELRARALLVGALSGMLLSGHPETALAGGVALALRWLPVGGRALRAGGRRERAAAGAALGCAALALLLTAFFTFPLAQSVLHSEKLARALDGGPPGQRPAGAAARASAAAAVNVIAPRVLGTREEGGEGGPAPFHWLAEGAVGLPVFVLAVGGLAAGRRRRPREAAPRPAARAPVGHLALLAALCYAIHLDPGLLFARLFALPPLSAVAPRYFAYVGAFAVSLLAAVALARWDAAGGGAEGPSRRASRRALLTGLAGVAVALLTAVQLRAAFAGYVPTVAAAVAYPGVPLLERLAREPGPFRVAGTRAVLPANAAVVYRLADVRTHDPAESARYVAWLRDLLGLDARRYHKHLPPPRPEHLGPLRLLGVRFVLSGRRLRLPAPWIDRGRFGETRLWELPGEVRWAFFPERWLAVGSPAAARGALRGRGDPHSLAAIETADPGARGAPAPNGSARVLATRVAGDAIACDVAVQDDAWLVVSQAAVPGWRARADGRRTRLAVADGALLAVRVPAGTRQVTLRYSPGAWRGGLAVSLLGAVVAAFGLGRSAWG